MPNYTADEFIGKTLLAKNNVWQYKGHPLSTSKIMVLAGSTLGAVDSWVKDPQNAAGIYWVFDKNGLKYYVQHSSNNIGLHPAETAQTIEDKKKAEAEAQKKEDMGAIPYYIEKYGKPVLILAGAGMAVKLGVAYMNRNKQR